MRKKFKLQESEYSFPYHYLVEFNPYSNIKYLTWGLEYYSYIQATINYLTFVKYRSLLDIGCGDGKLINILAKNNIKKKYTGLDISVPAILYAQAFNYGLKNTSFICKDIKQISAKYDVVVLNEVLEHIPDDEIEKFVNEVKKRVVKGGLIIVTVPTKNIKMPPKHYRHYNLVILKSHFKNEHIIFSEYVFKYPNKLVKKFFMILERLSFAKKIEFWLAKKILFKATEKNGRHLFCVLKNV